MSRNRIWTITDRDGRFLERAHVRPGHRQSFDTVDVETFDALKARHPGAYAFCETFDSDRPGAR